MPRNSEPDVIKEAKERIEKLRNEMSELQTQLGFIVAISLLVVTPFLIEPELRPPLEEEVFEIMRFY